MEKNISGLPELFLEFIKNYGLAQCNKMSLRNRIKLIKEQYIPIYSIESSYLVERNLDTSMSSYSSRTSSISSFSENNIIKKDTFE